MPVLAAVQVGSSAAGPARPALHQAAVRVCSAGQVTRPASPLVSHTQAPPVWQAQAQPLPRVPPHQQVPVQGHVRAGEPRRGHGGCLLLLGQSWLCMLVQVVGDLLVPYREVWLLQCGEDDVCLQTRPTFLMLILPH